MKLFLLAILVAAVAASPKPLDDDNQAVELIVNGVPEGQALELGDIVDIKLKEHAQGELVASSDLLHPFTAVGLAEAAAVAAAAAEVIEPTPVEFVGNAEEETVEPVVVLSPIILPAPVLPDVIVNPEVQPIPVPSVVVPNPAPVVITPIVAEPVVPVVPKPVAPVIIIPTVTEEIAPVPVPAPQLSNEIFNDGIVQVQVNGQEAGVLSTLQSWFNLIVNYFNDGVPTSHQIV